MGSRGAGSGRKTGGMDNRPPELKALDNSSQWAMSIKDIKVGDEIDADVRYNGVKKRVSWTFHPEGYDTFKSEPMSDIKVTDIKVTSKTVKVTGLFDTIVNARRGSGQKKGEKTIKVTKTFKVSDIVMKRKPESYYK